MLKRKEVLLALGLLACLRANDWKTFGGDPQRAGWAKEETALTAKSAERLKLLRSVKLKNEPRFMHGLTAPVVKEGVINPQSGGTVTDVVIVGGSSNHVFAIDADTGAVLWQRDLAVSKTAEEAASKTATYILCAKALNATPVITSGDGFMQEKVYTVASDGRLHALSVATGKSIFEALQFVPPFAKAWSLNLVDGVVYSATSQRCGNEPSSVFAVDFRDPKRPVKSFQAAPGGAGIWGRAGVAISHDGTVFMETGDGPWNPAAGAYSDSVIALSGKELKLLDFFTPTNFAYLNRKDLDMGSISPVAFPYRGRTLVAASGKEGVIFLLDAESLGSTDHRAPLFCGPRYANDPVALSGHGMWGAFSTWEDAQKRRWLVVPSWGPVAKEAPKFLSRNGEIVHGCVMAFTVEDDVVKRPVLVPQWASRDMAVPEPAAIAGDVVFALSNGANVAQVTGEGVLDQKRYEHPMGNAVLYALNAATGKELWSSGKTITSWTHFSGLAIANGRVFVTTYDGTLWIFGIE